LADFLTIAIQNPSAASGSVDTRLNRPDFVGVGGTSPAVQTPLRGQEIEMALVAMPARLTDRELTFLDLAEAASTKGAPRRWIIISFAKPLALRQGLGLVPADTIHCWRYESISFGDRSPINPDVCDTDDCGGMRKF
jgi:hypothetical protein